VEEVHRSNCPRCSGPGPLDVYKAHQVWSALVLTSWSSRPALSCKSWLKFYFAMRQAGQATYFNAAFHFLRIYNFIFRRIRHGATRLQEILADRVAAQTYGAPAFQNGLTHVIRRSLEFEAAANWKRRGTRTIKFARPATIPRDTDRGGTRIGNHQGQAPPRWNSALWAGTLRCELISA
jgi:hypothetical protein